VNVSRRSKPLLFSILLIAVVVLPLTVFLLQKEQVFQNFAWFTTQSAVSQCSSTTGTAVINATFSNTENSTAQNMNVVVNDLQTGTFVNMGTVKSGASKTVTIDTKKTSIKSGTVVYNLTWTSGASGTDSRSATYTAVNSCSAPTPTPTPQMCTAAGQASAGICQWDALPGADGYNVVVKETDTGAVVQTTTAAADATQTSFPMTPGKPYQCTVSATNECGNGTPSSGTPITCPVVTPTPPPPTAPVCSPTQGICQWDAVSGATSYNIVVQDISTSQNITSTTVQAPATQFSFPDNGTDTYQCNVQAVNECSQSTPTNSPPNSCTGPTPTPTTPVVSPSPTPTPAPSPSPTPFPTATPAPTATPIPTLTPAVTITILTQPPQQIVRTIPGQTQTQVVQGPNQTNVVVQPGQTQTVVVTRPPTPTMPATGSSTPTLVLIGTSAILLFAGGLIFFIL
jgi:hypothetical protein